MRIATRFILPALVLCSIGFAATPAAQAQTPSVTKQCGDKWAAAKAAGTTGGLTWPKFLSQCRSEMAAQPAAETTSQPSTPAAAGTPPASTRSSRSSAPATAPSTGNAVFPTAVSSKYSTLSPGRARMQTCLDQYNANKPTGANGGLKWIQKGGGYYSQCNARLKG